MSDNWMIVLSVDPLAKPSKEQAEAAVGLLSELRPGADEVELHISDAPEFFDCGANFKSVFCPFCGTDIEKWWVTAINAWDNEKDPRLLGVETPCCGRPTSLNDLDYDSPQGFACVAIELMNPEADLEPEERLQVEAKLGLAVRIVWRHI